MPTFRQHLAQFDPIELKIIARNQGITPDELDGEDVLDGLLREMLDPAHVQEVWADLPEDARQAMMELARSENGLPVAVFQRRFGQLRRIGPGRLQAEQPWKTPTGPAETLWYLGWIARAFRPTPEGTIEFISIPEDLMPLLPLETDNTPSEPPLPSPVSPPEAPQDLGELLLDDLGTLLAYVQNHVVWLRKSGRWRQDDLQQLLPRLRLSRIRKQPLEWGGPLHLIFFAARKLELLTIRNRRQRFGRPLRAWLEQSRSQQMASLFHVWQQADDWNDLCLAPELRCQEGAWSNDPVLARQALLAQLSRAEPGAWYDLDAFIAMIYEHLPDFQRPDGVYDTWYIQNTAGEPLRGFNHWPAVEGRLIRYIWQGPLFWLGAVALGASGDVWSLTAQGKAFLHQQIEETDSSGPILTVERDYSVILAPHIGLWDRLRVALFAFWQASEPQYRYLITQRGLRRAAQHGVAPLRVLDFLDRASEGAVPGNVRKVLETFKP